MLGKMRERIASVQVLARPRGCGGRRRRLGHWCCWCPSSTVPTFFPVFPQHPGTFSRSARLWPLFFFCERCRRLLPILASAARASPFYPIAPVFPRPRAHFPFFSLLPATENPPLHPRSSASFSGCPAYPFPHCDHFFFLVGALCCTGPSSFRPPAKARALGFFSSGRPRSFRYPAQSSSQHNQPKARTTFPFSSLARRVPLVARY